MEIFVVAFGNQTNGFRETIDIDADNIRLNVLRMKISAMLYRKFDEETYQERYRMFKIFKLIATEHGPQAQLIVNDVDVADCFEIHVLPSGGPGGINKMVPEQIPQRSGWFSRKWQFASSQTRTESMQSWFLDEAPLLSMIGFYSEQENAGTNFITCWHCDSVHNSWGNKNSSNIVKNHLYFKPECPLHRRQEALENIRRAEETIRVGSHLNNTVQMILLNKNLCVEKALVTKLTAADVSKTEVGEIMQTGIKCVICLEPKASVINLPCRHEATCIRCCHQLRKLNPSAQNCQICGAKVRFAVQAFRDYIETGIHLSNAWS